MELTRPYKFPRILRPIFNDNFSSIPDGPFVDGQGGWSITSASSGLGGCTLTKSTDVGGGGLIGYVNNTTGVGFTAHYIFRNFPNFNFNTAWVASLGVSTYTGANTQGPSASVHGQGQAAFAGSIKYSGFALITQLSPMRQGSRVQQQGGSTFTSAGDVLDASGGILTCGRSGTTMSSNWKGGTVSGACNLTDNTSARFAGFYVQCSNIAAGDAAFIQVNRFTLNAAGMH